jgi:hypothetical protein
MKYNNALLNDSTAHGPRLGTKEAALPGTMEYRCE